MDNATLIRDVLSPLAGKRILDVGCGKGALLRSLSKQGATAVGVDPAATPGGADDAFRIVAAGAEKLPFPDGSFDAAVFLNSFHHVPLDLMDVALAEASRVVVHGGTVIVIEPLASGTFFEALRPIEDETAIRAAAQAAISRAVDAGLFRQAARHQYDRHDAFPSIEPFLQRVVDADDERRHVIAAKRPEIEAAFVVAAGRDAAGAYTLEQPILARVLAKT